MSGADRSSRQTVCDPSPFNSCPSDASNPRPNFHGLSRNFRRATLSLYLISPNPSTRVKPQDVVVLGSVSEGGKEVACGCRKCRVLLQEGAGGCMRLHRRTSASDGERRFRRPKAQDVVASRCRSRLNNFFARRSLRLCPRSGVSAIRRSLTVPAQQASLEAFPAYIFDELGRPRRVAGNVPAL